MPRTTKPPRPVLAERSHLRGCPAERVEAYEATKPATASTPSAVLTVVRCQDCGGQDVTPGRLDDVLARPPDNQE